MKCLSEERGVDMPTVEPRATIQVLVAGEVYLIIRIPGKSGQRSYIEQCILSDVLSDNDFAAESN
ncbi:hypothetical protein [Aliifodinibius salipaludis]|uniref:hypothetical protein n=1 Tax=Fodinibius salipaludis TaxID=2032627 RepID=UPI001C3E8DBB|nr:hypothetical protein [Aliifodinibius salipaludis]